MAIFGKSRKREDTAKYPREFVGLVAAIDDTPTLIRRIAENRYYMACCSAVLKGDQNTTPLLKGFYGDLKTEARRRNISFDRLREKLEPVAAALGLHIITPDAMQADYYRILGIAPDADGASIKKAYRTRAMTAHPDTGSGGDLFLAVHEAYHVLSDAALRRQYDLSRRHNDHRQWHEDKHYAERDAHGPKPAGFDRNIYLFIIIFVVLAGVAVIADYEVRQRSLYDDAAAPAAVNQRIAAVEKAGNQEGEKKTGNQESDEKKLSRMPVPLTPQPPPATAISIPAVPVAPVAPTVSTFTSIAQTALEKQISPVPPATPVAGVPPPATAVDSPPAPPIPPVPMIYPPLVVSEAPPPVVFNEILLTAASPLDRPEAEVPKMEVTEPEMSVSEVEVPKSQVPEVQASKLQVPEGPPAGHTASIERGPGKNSADMRDDLERFLVQYCEAYEGRDLDRFVNFFAHDATENEKPVSQLLPQYRENFGSMAFIHYRIEMLGYQWDVKQNRVRMEGEFVLEWMKSREETRHQYRGTIDMTLAPEKDSFLIRALRYQFID